MPTNKGQFQKGHKLGLGNKYKLGISAWNKGLTKSNSNTKGGRKFGSKDKKKRNTVNYSLSKIGSKNPRFGKRPSNWKGTTPKNKLIRDSIEYKLWRKSVFERDNYTCIWCGNKGYLNADHIQTFAEYPELRFAIDNGRTLCRECHYKRHRKEFKYD